MILNIAKRLRAIGRDLASWFLSLLEFSLGSLVAVFTGRFSPIVAEEEQARTSLIVCPSPLLNEQTVNISLRDRYTISFVNSACLSPTFTMLRPERMFLIDPAFFSHSSIIANSSSGNDSVDRILLRIVEATSWPMKLIVPWHYRHSSATKLLAANPNISVCGIPVFNSYRRDAKVKMLGFRWGILNPVYQNVLIAALFYSLKAGHSRTVIWGAHHTWLLEVQVDESNRVLHSIRHSDEQRVGTPLINFDGSPRRYHTYLQQLAIVFEQYHFLRDYADSFGQEIINATEDSLIDAFKRAASIELFSMEEGRLS